jgi:transposase
MEAMGLLPLFRGSLVHDCLGAYFKFLKIRHYLCLAHILRELIFVHEELNQVWAQDMINLLIEAKKLSEQAEVEEEIGRTKISKRTRRRIKRRYDEIIEEGKRINPEPSPLATKKRGRVKRSKPLNLLIRLDKRKSEALGFFDYGYVPFDNNQAERDLRMMKVREKISGTFRAEAHAKAFCDIRGIISSARKQSYVMRDTLADLIVSPISLGNKLAEGK